METYRGCVIVEWSGDIQGMCNSGMEWRHTGEVY